MRRRWHGAKRGAATRACITAVFLALLCTAASAQPIVWDVLYDGSVLPGSANPKWTQNGTATTSNSTVSGGILTLTNSGGRSNTWDRDNDPLLGGTLSVFEYDDPATPEEDFVNVSGHAFTLEWKMKVNSPASGITASHQTGVKLDLVLPPNTRVQYTFYYDSATQRLANTFHTYPTVNPGVGPDGNPIGDGFAGIAAGDWHTYKLTCARIGSVWIRELWLDDVYLGRWSTERMNTNTAGTVKMRVNTTSLISGSPISVSFDDVRYDATPHGRHIRPAAPIVTGLSPTLVGKTQTPPSATITLKQPAVADGVVFRIDSNGLNRHYEIDADGSWNPAHYRLPVSTLESDIAGVEMAAAINADPLAQWRATFGVPDGFRWLVLAWEDASHYGAANGEVNDPTDAIGIGAFRATEPDDSPTWMSIEGAALGGASSVAAVHSSGSPSINGTFISRSEDLLNVQFSLQPWTIPLGTYHVVVTSDGGSKTVENAFELVENHLKDASFRLFISGSSLSPNWNSWNSLMSAIWQKDNTWPDMTVCRNGRTWEIPNPRQYPVPTAAVATNAGDREHGSIQWSTADGPKELWQTLKLNFAAPTRLSMRGLVAGGVHTTGPMAYGVELRSGGRHGTVIARTPPSVIVDRFTWKDFALCGEVPAGPVDLTVVIWADSDSEGDKALHIDDMLLWADQTSTVTHAIASLGPAYGVRGSVAHMGLTGTFVPGASTVLLRRSGQEDIPGMATAWAGHIDTTFDLSTAAPGFYDVVVSAPGHVTLVAGQMFNVVLHGPALSNGGFELPEHVASCPPLEPVVDVTDWFVRQIGWYFRPLDSGTNWNPDGNWYVDPVFVRRNVTSRFAPSCPPPEGAHYAATYSSMPEPKERLDVQRPLQVMQTVTVTPGATYSLSGFFAAAGPNRVRLMLLDGDCTAPPVAGGEATVFTGTGNADWQLAYVAGTANSGLATATWETTNLVTGDKRSYADGLELERCISPVSVVAVSPTSLNSGMPGASLAISGSGFLGGAPEVYLVRTGGTVKADSVQVNSANKMTCMFDIPVQAYAAWDVVVKNQGCFATLANAVDIAPGALMNGEFELPAEPLSCGPPPTIRTSPVVGWSFSSQLIRDGNVHYPVPCPCPDSLGGHYGSMSTGDGIPQQAWQTLRVSRNGRYRFSGYFAGGGSAQVSLKLIDGADPDGSPLAQTFVNLAGDTYSWRFAEVEASAPGELMTAVWEMASPSGICATHADGLVFESTRQCNIPFADVEPDGDVDLDDFAFLQRCLTIGDLTRGLTGADEYCHCLDTHPLGAPDGQITALEVLAFEQCSQGPGIAPDLSQCP